MARQDYIVGDSFRVIMQDGTMTIRHDGYDKALAAIERVRELHKPVDLGSGYIECSECMASEHPCRTIQALDGEQA